MTNEEQLAHLESATLMLRYQGDRITELTAALAQRDAELAEARKDGERYRYIRTEAMIDYCTGSKRHNRISWPTIYAAAPVDGGSYRDRFDAAIATARGTR